MTTYLISLSLLICAVLLIRWIFRKTVSPRAIYVLWLVVVLRMCLPITLFEVAVQMPDFPQYEKTEQQQEIVFQPAETAEREGIETPVREPVQSPLPMTKEPEIIMSTEVPIEVTREEETSVDVGRIFMTIWLTGSAVMAAWFSITGGIYHHRLRKDRRLHTELGRIKVYVSESAGVPCIAGIVPSIYITPSAAGSEAEELIIHHEYTHLCHGDHIWSLFRVLALTAFWYHPLVWIAAAVSRQDAELACDDAVVSGMTYDERMRYAHILVDTIPQKHRYAVGFGSAPMKARILRLTEQRKNGGICLILALVLSVSAVGCSFMGKPALTIDNIQEQNGFTILSQERKQVDLILPMEKLPTYEEVCSAENSTIEMEDIPVFITDTTEVFLHTVGVSGHDPEAIEKDVLYFGFDIRHILAEAGAVYTVNRVMNEDGRCTYTSEFYVQEETLQKYDRSIRMMGNGPNDNFYLYIDAALYAELQDNLKIEINLNEIQYERGTEVKVYGKENRQSSEHDTAETLKIPEISLTQVEKLPRSEAAALFSASPVGGNPTIYFFENDLSFYIRMYPSVDAECIYYSGNLTLPEGFSGGRVVRAAGGGGSGETFVTVCAEQDGRTVYLDYFINYNNEPFLPDFVYVLDDQQVTELRDAMNNMPIHRDIYLCDDVYRSADTPTHGSADVFIPIALTDYTVTECQILLCEDGCDPTDVVSRAFWGYGPAWRIDQYEEYRAADGWRFATRRYINEVPEDIREQMRNQGAPDSVIYPREYLYLVTLEPGKYAFIVIEPNEPDGEKPTDEIEQVNGFIQNMEVIVEVPVSEDELAEEIIMPVEEVTLDYAGEWYHSFSEEGMSQFYYFAFRPEQNEMSFYYGGYESEYANCYVGNYTIDENGIVTANMYDRITHHSESDIQLELEFTEIDAQKLTMRIRSCDEERYSNLIGTALLCTREPLIPVKIPTFDSIELFEEEISEVVTEEPEDWLVDEDSAPYTYTREEWIQYSLYTDFGFRDPVDVSALTDDELTAYMADAYQCALDIYFLFHVSSDRMYARNIWNSTMPHVEIDGRYYSQMFNPVFPTLTDLESYMNGVLSPDLTKQLLAMDMFIDYEGELWGMMGARGTNISKKTVGFSVTSRTDTEIIYTAEVEVREYDLGAEEPDYVEYHNFTYALTEDGWRWTDFYLYN